MLILVEGLRELQIVSGLLRTAGMGDAPIMISEGSLHPRGREVRSLVNYGGEEPLLIVYDQESGSLADAVDIQEHLHGVQWCPAIPSVEAWLFTDDDALREVVGAGADEIISRMPL